MSAEYFLHHHCTMFDHCIRFKLYTILSCYYSQRSVVSFAKCVAGVFINIYIGTEFHEVCVSGFYIYLIFYMCLLIITE